jgi:hypothetical protein
MLHVNHNFNHLWRIYIIIYSYNIIYNFIQIINKVRMISTINTSLEYADINTQQIAPQTSHRGPLASMSNDPRPQLVGGGGGGDAGYLNNQNQNPEDATRTNSIGLRDRIDTGSGMVRENAQDVQITSQEYNLVVDTRDCIGEKSLIDAQYVAGTKGIRPFAEGIITNVVGSSPVTVTATNVSALRDGDYVLIKGLIGASNLMGQQYVQNVNSIAGTFQVNISIGLSYISGGQWSRENDPGYPLRKDTESIIEGNTLIANLSTTLKQIRTVSLYNIVIPRDIIPLEVYLSDFIPVSTTYYEYDYVGTTETSYVTFIKEEEQYTRARMLGFYSSPLDLWRAYRYGNMSIQDPITPIPLQLWNPPGPGVWPEQPIPYPQQCVPTYRSADFTVPGADGLFRIILAGYGLYDLLDWTANDSTPAVNALKTSIMRKLLLILITPKQSYRDVDYVSLILASNTVTPGNIVYPYGYGSYQRCVCGPGIGSNYQPCTNVASPVNPRIITVDNPINFPNYSGNVWGPYSGPGARFQYLGARTTIQDLYLNGDLNNLGGDSIILNDVPTEGFSQHPTYGLNFLSLIEVNLGNIQAATNPNITNAMRIVSNGFGTATVFANGGGAVYINKFRQHSGGQGPSSMNSPSTWSDQSLFGVGTGSIDDPIAKGPLNGDFGPEFASATTDINSINKLTSYYDLGPNNGQLIGALLKYIDYAVNEIPDTDLIIKLAEAETSRGIRSLSTNSNNSTALIGCSIRLSIGSANGTLQYIESVQSLVSVCNGFWETRYMAPRGKINQLTFMFYTYDGTPIPLEKMLQQRRTANLLLLTNRLVTNLNIDPFNIPYLFDPLNPRLIGRVKRYFNMILKVNCYEMSAPGLATTSMQGIPPNVSGNYEGSSYN